MAMTFERMVAECARRRDKYHRSGVEFFEYLLGVETTHQKIWQAAGYARFHQFLKARDMCDAHKFEAYKRARAEIGLERVKALGVDGAIRARTALHPRGPRRDLDTLVTENSELKRQLEIALRENRQLRAENEELRRQLGKKAKKAA